MCGISQRPADVKKDFITQCDWLVWHRLTWGNDTKVVQRILGSDYAGWVEGLNDGEGFLMTDWDEEVRQVQFQRKRTFDAGATPGLEDFERPELKSVSGDLVSDLAEITEEKQARQNQVREMERKLNDKQLRIETLEEKLVEARDLSNMAEQFAQAMMTQATEREFHEDAVGYQANLAKARWTGHG
jgi:predicted ATP-dependent endonuclease of OLD family